MNRVQVAFIGIFAVILTLDLVVALGLSAVQGSTVVATARLVTGLTAILLFAGGLLLMGSTRSTPGNGMQNSPVFVTPSFGRLLREDRARQARGVSEYPVVGVIYGLFLVVVTFFLYLLPG